MNRGRPEQQQQNRPCYAITTQAGGTDLASNYASALALTALALGDTDPTYSAQLIAEARKLYTFANNYRAIYSVSVPEAAEFYSSYDYLDELHSQLQSWLSSLVNSNTKLTLLIFTIKMATALTTKTCSTGITR